MAKSAKACPHCGAKNNKPIYTKVWFWLLVLVAAIVFFFTVVVQPIEEISATINGESVTSEELLEEYAQNEVAFDEKYHGVPVEVISKIQEIRQPQTLNGIEFNTTIVLEGNWWFNIHGDDSFVNSLSVGDEVTISGLFNFVFNNDECLHCTFVELK